MTKTMTKTETVVDGKITQTKLEDGGLSVLVVHDAQCVYISREAAFEHLLLNEQSLPVLVGLLRELRLIP